MKNIYIEELKEKIKSYRKDMKEAQKECKNEEALEDDNIFLEGMKYALSIIEGVKE